MLSNSNSIVITQYPDEGGKQQFEINFHAVAFMFTETYGF